MKVVFEHTHNFTARLIQFWMIVDALVHGKWPAFTYNHSYLENNGMVWEAIGNNEKPKGGVVCRSMSEHLAEKKYSKPFSTKEFELNLNAIQLMSAISYLKKQEGKKYEVLNFLFHPIRTFLDRWIGSRSDKRLYCHELSIRAMNASGKYSLDPFLNPREFFEEMNQLKS